ncbi:uncharacterized protein LOC127380944 isoform X2 [Apus apus]|uniref:uncharacterized protein LOC127380944 isoform X2 n=1 Tax=Apus apus TaxID=8895 RepID=UPI0021F8D388|nr:uncharacterized protein LOC127380944 isoform X2 [Apus apus]
MTNIIESLYLAQIWEDFYRNSRRHTPKACCTCQFSQLCSKPQKNRPRKDTMSPWQQTTSSVDYPTVARCCGNLATPVGRRAKPGAGGKEPVSRVPARGGLQPVASLPSSRLCSAPGRQQEAGSTKDRRNMQFFALSTFMWGTVGCKRPPVVPMSWPGNSQNIRCEAAKMRSMLHPLKVIQQKEGVREDMREARMNSSLWLLLSLPHIWSLCLPSGCSWAWAEKLRQSCCSFFPCAIFQDGLSDALLHPYFVCTVVILSWWEPDRDSLELLTYSWAHPAAASPWLSMHQKDNACCDVLAFLLSQSPWPALPPGVRQREVRS